MTELEKAVCCLSELYHLGADEVRARLATLGATLNLKETSPVWDQISQALSERQDRAMQAMDSINELLSQKEMSSIITAKMQALEKEFIGLFSANKIEAACYHFYGHGIEMSRDPGDFISTLLPKGTMIAPMLIAITNALGAAHDIIQGKMPPPTNEIESADIFTKRTQEMINELIKERRWVTVDDLKTRTALEHFRDKGVYFLARECIVNSTYLVFGSGKRDFDNLLYLTHKALAPDTKSILDPRIAAMKMSLALSDTRRSEMRHVLEKLEVLNSIPEAQIEALEMLLHGIKLLEPGVTINQLKMTSDVKKLIRIEGFLLRIGQNIRMSSELSVVFAKPADLENAKERVQLISDLRADQSVVFSIEKHLQPFLKSIPGEMEFAKALAAIDKTEIRHQATFYGLHISDSDMDLLGWAHHADDLEACKHCLESAPVPGNMALMLFTLAAKSPGHRVDKDTYVAMNELAKKLPKGSLLDNLIHDIEEIRLANPHLQEPSISSSRATMFSGTSASSVEIEPDKGPYPSERKL